MRKPKLSSALLFVLLGAGGIWVLTHPDGGCALAGSEIVCQMKLEQGKIGRGRADVTHVVAKYIPVGMTVDAAREILEKNGFKIYKTELQPMDKRDLPDGSYHLSGTTTEWSIILIANYEYRIVLTIADGQVASMFARIFFTAL